MSDDNTLGRKTFPFTIPTSLGFTLPVFVNAPQKIPSFGSCVTDIEKYERKIGNTNKSQTNPEAKIRAFDSEMFALN